MTSLPVLDIAPFLSDESAAVALDFVEQLRETLHGPGFCYLTGHGVTASSEAAVMRVAREFFHQPEAKRLEIVNTNTPHFRGYTRLGMEHTNGASDWRDQIDIGPEHEPLDLGPDGPIWLRVRGPNQWPASVPAMQPTLTDWIAEMGLVGTAVLRAIALGLGQPAEYFEPFMQPHPEVLVKIIRYPAPTHDGGATGQGVGLHNDSGLLSFILQDDVGGLQVLLGDELVDATPVPGALILNIGEMLQIATDGYLRATKHQVVSPPPGRERISIAYFHNPAMEATFEQIPLPAGLAARTRGSANERAQDTIFSNYGDNWLKFRVRSHPDVAAIHHPDLLGMYD